MRFVCFFFFLVILPMDLFGQSCSIISKANTIVPDKLCSPVSVAWHVSYTGVDDAGTLVQIQYNWDDGTTILSPATKTGPGVFEASANHTYISTGNKCNYSPQATLMVNGVLCTSSSQQQIVTVWDNDDNNGGKMHISPTVFPICFGNSANARFQDLTQFNCVPPQERDVPNLFTRWIQWIYGTDITMTGTPVTINGTSRVFPFDGPVITLPGPVTGSGVWSDIMNVANDKLVGQHFQVTLRNWNYCNPYDDPNIPGPPADPVNGDHPPVVTTAIILIVPFPDATITPVDTLCLTGDPVTLHAHDGGGTWSGDGVTGNKFDPENAGTGDHIIHYTITDANGCSDDDQVHVYVTPVPVANINPVNSMFITDPQVPLIATPPGGSFSGNGVTGNMFYPGSAGVGIHIITYQTLTDKFGCAGKDTIHIKVMMPPPDATINPVDTLCIQTGPVTLTAHDSGGTWSGDGVINDKFFPGLAGAGDHNINYQISDTNGFSDSDHITITVMPAPVVSINPVDSLFINNPPVVLDSSPAGGIFTGNGINGGTFYPDSAGIGVHMIIYQTLTDRFGCSARDTTYIKVMKTPPDGTITPLDTLCIQSDPVTLTAHDEGGTWSGDGVVNDKFFPVLAGLGDHIISYEIADTNGFSDSDQIIITVMPPPVVNINAVTVLFINDPAILLTASPAGGTFTGNGIELNTFNPGKAGVGSHIITYKTITDRYGCSANDTIHIEVVMPPKPVADFGPDTVGCTPLFIKFINKSIAGDSYFWEFGDKMVSSDPNPSHTYNIPGNYIVKLTVTNISGQSTHTGSVSVFQKPTSLFSIYPTYVINNSQIVVFTNYSNFAESFLWNFGDGNTGTEENPWHKYLSEGVYQVTLTVRSKEGCIDSMRYQSPVNVEFKTGDIRFPNAFRWNMSGPTGGYWNKTELNDNIFRPFFENVIDYKLQVYNRWGILIYESNDINKGWDGYFGSGNLAVQGVYVWKVTGRYADGSYFNKVGDVTFLH